MQALTVVPGTPAVRLMDRPEPAVTAADEVKVRIIRVGICGTDREEAAGGRACAPAGQADLIIGHEMLGQVVASGDAVTRVRLGDYAVMTVRRGCGRCLPCAMSRPDMCATGDYAERGIWALDGFQSEYAVDHESSVVRVPSDLEPVAVLTEPLSVIEKALDESVRVQQARLPQAGATPDWIFGRPCLVAGLGPIGLLAALALRLRGAEVFGLDIVDEGTPRPRWLTHIGGRYIDGRQVPAERVAGTVGPVDVIVEATGVPALAFNLLDALAPDGACILTGIPGGDRSLQVPGAEIIRRLVLNNQILIGSVNAARDHFQMAVDDLAAAQLRWGDHVERLITHRHRSTEAASVLGAHLTDEIKAVVEWT